MEHEPDGRDVVATADAAASLPHPPLLVRDRLREYLAQQGFTSDGLAWERIGDGHSNITYALEVGGRSLVLRRGPRPPHPPSTHDMLREARIQRLLGAHGVPVPRIVAVCDDPGVLGVPFYLMEHVEGAVITDALPVALAGSRADIAFAAVDALADLHAIDVSGAEFAALGRAEGYLARQISRFRGLWDAVSTRSTPAIPALADWLEAHRPAESAASVVHGDYRIGNLMFRPGTPVGIAAIFDWEMATLGDPLADLGYFIATYAEAGAVSTPLELTPITRDPGFPERAALIERYVARTGRDLSRLDWYRALALFKAAVFCEAIYTRWRAGERPGDTFAPTLAVGVPTLLREAADAAGIAVEHNEIDDVVRS